MDCGMAATISSWWLYGGNGEMAVVTHTKRRLLRLCGSDWHTSCFKWSLLEPRKIVQCLDAANGVFQGTTTVEMGMEIGLLGEFCSQIRCLHNHTTDLIRSCFLWLV